MVPLMRDAFLIHVCWKQEDFASVGRWLFRFVSIIDSYSPCSVQRVWHHVGVPIDLPRWLLCHVIFVHFTGFEHSRCVDAVTVALNQMSGGNIWYTLTKELQLASLQLCEVCRDFTTLALTVDEQTPRSLLASEHPAYLSWTRMRRSRVPQLRARRVKWSLSTAAEFRRPIYALTETTVMEFGDTFDDTLTDTTAMRSSESLENFGTRDNSVEDDELDFGLCWLFEEPTAEVSSPASPFCMTLVARLEQTQRNIVLPASVRQLTFGRSFDRPLEGVVWPVSLEQLTFGDDFDQPIERVVFPASLQQLTFGNNFDFPIQEMQWPISLRLRSSPCRRNVAAIAPTANVWRSLQPADRESGVSGIPSATDVRGILRPSNSRHAVAGISA